MNYKTLLILSLLTVFAFETGHLLQVRNGYAVGENVSEILELEKKQAEIDYIKAKTLKERSDALDVNDRDTEITIDTN